MAGCWRIPAVHVQPRRITSYVRGQHCRTVRRAAGMRTLPSDATTLVRPMSALIAILVWSSSATAALLALAHHVNTHLPTEGNKS